MSRQFRFITALLLAFTLVIAACGKKTKDSGAYAHLEYIPADTPYALLSLKPFPEDIQDQFSESYDDLIKAYSSIASRSYQDYMDKARGDSDENSDADKFWDNNWVKAIQKEFADGFSLDKMEQFGLDKKSTYAFYGNGVLPVFRIRLSDTKLFSETIARIEKNADSEIPEKQVAGMQVWSISDKSEEDHGELIIALSDVDLIVTYLPASATQSMLEQLIGKQKPAQALSSTDTINNLMKAKSYLPESLGYIDFQQILNRFINEPTGLDKEFLAMFEDFADKREELSDVCKAELQTTVATVPRLVYGLTTLNKNLMVTESVFEVRSDLAKEMSKLTAPVPGLGSGAGFFSMGVSFDIPEMRDFAVRRIEALKAKPFECEFMKTDVDDLDKTLKAINNPAAGFVESVHGFNFVLDDIELNSLMKMIQAEEESGSKPSFSEIQELLSDKFSAYVVFAADNPKTMVNMGKMMSPELAGLEIKDDAKSVLINDLFPEPVPFDVFAAMNDKALTLSMGKNADSKAERVLGLATEKNAPLLSYSLDMKKYMQVLDSILSNPELAEAMSEDEDVSIEEIRGIMQAFMGMFGTATFNIKLREDGIAFEQELELK